MIAGMLRIKNESRWIRRCLDSILPLCDMIWVLDDHSTDDTVNQCWGYKGKVITIKSQFDGLDEVRDKNVLLDMVMDNRKPEWIIAIDGDEMLAPGAADNLKLAMTSGATCLSLKVLYLWDSEQQVRMDGVYGDFHRESVFRPDGAQFIANGNGGNFHCGNVPWHTRQKRTVLQIPLLHFGYIYKEDRLRKYEFYNSADPGNEREDCYRHMVIGDLFPSESRFVHGGPLKLQPL